MRLISACLAVLWAGGLLWAQPARQPRAATSSPTSLPATKFAAASPARVEKLRKLALSWAEESKAFAPTIHLVETPHFLVFSAWEKSSDAPLSETCETMYRALCSQFDIPPAQNIWAGKCALYVFGEKEQFKRFTTEVDKAKLSEASGYCGGHSDGFCYIVLGPVRTRGFFHEMIVHEGTHAFMNRYLTNRRVPSWVQEGFAEYMAATLVPEAGANRKYLDATKDAIKNRKDITPVFAEVELKSFDYGIAQSLVRYLIVRDRTAFAQFIKLLKEGKSEANALQESYGLTRETLVRDWTQTVARNIR